MVVEFLRKGGKLVVVHHHGKAFLAVLTDERLDDGEGLTRTWRADHPRATERIDDVHPSPAELALVVVPHGDVHAVLVLLQLLTLLKAFVLKVESVFQQPFLQEFGDIVKSHMDADCTQDRGCHIEPDVQRDGVEPCVHPMTEEPDRQYGNKESADQRI